MVTDRQHGRLHRPQLPFLLRKQRRHFVTTEERQTVHGHPAPIQQNRFQILLQPSGDIQTRSPEQRPAGGQTGSRIVIARNDKQFDTQLLTQHGNCLVIQFNGLCIGDTAVKYITAEQHRLHLFLPDQIIQLLQEKALIGFVIAGAHTHAKMPV